MNRIDTHYEPKTIDCSMFVFNEMNPQAGHYTILAPVPEMLMMAYRAQKQEGK